MSDLEHIIDIIRDWSASHVIPVSDVIDTNGMYGVKIFGKYKGDARHAFDRLMESISPLVNDGDIYLEGKRVRGGMLLAFSHKAISERDLKSLVIAIEEHTNTMTFANRMDWAMHGPRDIDTQQRTTPAVDLPIDFNAQAQKIHEAQYKSATDGMLRSNQSSLQRETHSVAATYAGARRKGRRKPTSESWSYHTEPHSTVRLAYRIHEALEGMATPTGAQSSDIFANFGSALKEVGIRTGSGPIQDKLKERGIKYKKSDDGSEIILYVMNSETNAPQPIARISAETIANPTKFEEAIQNMIDLSEGNEPGAFETYRTKMQQQEKAVREVARSLMPTDPSQAAATTAAMPKVTA